MAKVSVTFRVTPDAGISGYWLHVNDRVVAITNGLGSIQLDGGAKYWLIWHAEGTAKSNLKIVGDENGAQLVSTSSSINENGDPVAGLQQFTA